jgi:hypothetical protein
MYFFTIHATVYTIKIYYIFFVHIKPSSYPIAIGTSPRGEGTKPFPLGGK